MSAASRAGAGRLERPSSVPGGSVAVTAVDRIVARKATPIAWSVCCVAL